MKAKAATKASGTLNIEFGLISIPVQTYNGVEEDSISRKMRVADGHEVGYQKYDKHTGELIADSDIYKVFVTEDGGEVPLNDDEIAAAMGEENGRSEIVGFYSLAEIDKYHVESVVQVRPKKDGKKNPFEKPFVLLMRGMEETKTFALLRYTLRGKPRLGVLTSDGNLSVVFWDNEVREPRPMPEHDVSDGEMEFAKTLIGTYTEAKAPLLDNDANGKVREFAETKKAGGAVVAPEAQAAEPAPDLVALMQKSIDAAKAAKK